MTFRRPFSLSLSVSAAFVASCLFLSPLAASTPDLALQADRMLSTSHWAQAVRIENTNESSRYPETVYATVFEFNDVLWFYTSTGSQPVEMSRNQTDSYKDNLLPLLRSVDRGFTSFVKLDEPEPTASTEFASLENGCVVESIYSLDVLKQQGEPILEAKVLLYMSANPTRSDSGRAVGHAVLVYRTPTGMHYVDPPQIDTTGTLEKVLEWDAIGIAAEIESHYGDIGIEDAFFEPFNLPVQGNLAQAG